MATYFADTSFWVALSNKRDQHHARALAWSQHVLSTQALILTTEPVLWEWMNALADVATRKMAAEGYRRLRRDRSVEVAPFRADLVETAVQLYNARHDKDWSLTDCFSFIVMQQRQLTRALTTDRHFQQAGFEPVMLAEPSEA